MRIRALRTAFAEEMIKRPGTPVSMPTAESLNKAWREGDFNSEVFAAGQITGMIKRVKSVREIIEEMVK